MYNNHNLDALPFYPKFQNNAIKSEAKKIPSSVIMSEKLCLQWNEFQENVKSSFSRLKNDKEFTDVTLACENGEQIEAHKVILASSSPFFENILQRNKHPHPLHYRKVEK